MLYRREILGGLASNALGRGIGRYKLGMRIFEVFEFPIKLVVFLVRYRRLVEDIIEMVVALYRFS